MRIIGIDPGSIITGIGIIEFNNSGLNLLSYNSIILNRKEVFFKRLKIIYNECLKKIKKYKPDQMAIETVFYGKNIQSMMKLGQARGVAILSALNSNLNIYEYSPREIKKSVTGYGGATKYQVQFMVKKILNIKENPVFFDSSDALATALCHYNTISENPKNFILSKNVKGKALNWTDYVKNHPEKILLNRNI